MSRTRRLHAPGTVQHVISRFLNRSRLFDTKGAREEYLRRVPRSLSRSDWAGLAYALMGTHVHWAMRAGFDEPSRFIQSLHTGFSRWLNVRKERLGPVFAERFRSLTFEGETAAALLAYLHNNPVRANVVSDPADSGWTSHRAYLGLEKAPPWLDVRAGLELCGFDLSKDGRWRFHEFVRSRAGEPRNPAFTADDADHQRKLARLEVGPVEIVTPTVRTDHDGQPRVHHRFRIPERVFRRGPRVDIPTILDTVGKTIGVEVDALHSRSRSRTVVSGRRLALVLWRQLLGQPTVEMARAIGIGEAAAAQLLSRAAPDVRRCAGLLLEGLTGATVAESEEVKTVPEQVKK